MREVNGYPSVRLAILGMTEEGMTPPQIAKALGIFKENVYGALKNKKPIKGIPSVIKCAQGGCEEGSKIKGLCRRHYDAHSKRDLRKRNGDAVRKKSREYRKRNREKVSDAQYVRYHEGNLGTAARRYYHKNKEKISELNKAKRKPTDLEGWAKRVRIKTITSVACRRLRDRDPGEAISLDVARALIEIAHSKGDVDFINPISAPSPDRLDNSRGYADDNIQIVPMWLNYAYHDWDKEAVEAEILKWAARRLGL